MQLTGTGRPCPGMDASSAAYEKSPKGQIRRPTRPEHVIAFEFLKFHYEEDKKAETPIQKSDVYKDYETYCAHHDYKPLVAADFGRILKSMFPNARDRRLGSRGSSKYCYVGVRRKSDSHAQSSVQNPYTVEDLCNAYQTVVCEWASTVLNRKLTSLEELAKFLLRNRQVQTRTCAALTITANLKDSEDYLSEPLPMNKHRETQIKLQEKLRERLLNKSRHNSAEDGSDIGLAGLHNHPHDSAFSSTSTTPDPEGMIRQAAMQVCSAPGSRRASPLTAMSVNSSACTSPVFAEQGIPQHVMLNGYMQPQQQQTHQQSQPLQQQPQQQSMDYQSNCAPSYDPGGMNRMNRGGNSISSQCNSAAGSGRTTPVVPPYHQQTGAPGYQYDQRIQSAPATPHPGYQPSSRFDFNQPPSVASQQCMSLPNSARNTPINEMHDVTPYYGQHNVQSQQFPSGWDGASQALGIVQEQRLEFGRSNSAFMPIKEGPVGSEINENYEGNPPFNTSNTTEFSGDEHGSLNSSEDFEINQLLSIMGEAPTNQNQAPRPAGSAPNYAPVFDRPTSVQEQAVPVSQQKRTSVIYNLLTSKMPTERLKQRYRHHSGPQLGYSTGSPHTSALPPFDNSHSLVDLTSPPSTPNGKFRPVTTPTTEMRMSHPGKPYAGPPRTLTSYHNHLSMNVAGTMSPPSQPLSKRRRQNSGELTKVSPQCSPALPQKLPDKTTSPDYIARRNLGGALQSPNIEKDIREANLGRGRTDSNPPLPLNGVLTPPSSSNVSPEEQRSV